MGLVPATGKLHSPTELFMFMLSHFLSPFFDNTRHAGVPYSPKLNGYRLNTHVLYEAGIS